MAATLKLSPALKTVVKLVVWDFDLTLLAIHSYHRRITPEQVSTGARNIEDDFADVATFRSLACHLVEKEGVAVAIASFGKYETVQAYMDAVFGSGQQHFTRDNISTPSLIGLPDGCSVAGGKNRQLLDLARRYKAPPHQVAFFDDSRNNVLRASHAGFVWSFECQEPFTADTWIEALGILQPGE